VAKSTAKKVNKSQAIRDYKHAHPDAKPKQISEALAKDGVEASPGFVSTILTKSKGVKGTRKRGRKRKMHSNGTMRAIEKGAHGALDSAFDFVHKVGGLLNAQTLIDKLKAFKERM
jgi:hypothetical protein